MLLIFLSVRGFGQDSSTPLLSDSLLLDSAKTLFLQQNNVSDEDQRKENYWRVVSMLESVLERAPTLSEAHYFLGYAYSWINATDAVHKPKLNVDLVLRSSEQMEQVIALTPRYTGQRVSLDPYSKLTATWGMFALSHWINDRTDSAVWAYKEGQARGAFSPFILALNRAVLEACSPNAILIASGDNFTHPLYYLQHVEALRTDVAVVDLSLLNSVWYPDFLVEKKLVRFRSKRSALQRIAPTQWTHTEVEVGAFSWMVPPSHQNLYLLRRDLVLLELIEANAQRRDIYFTLGMQQSEQVGLAPHLNGGVFANGLQLRDASDLPDGTAIAAAEKALKLGAFINPNSPNEGFGYDLLRYAVVRYADGLRVAGDKEQAKALLRLLDEHGQEDAHPYQHPSGADYVRQVREKLLD